MHDFTRKLAALAAMISMLSFWPAAPALAGSAADYVPMGSCSQEVSQVRAANPGADIDTLLNAPWVYRYDADNMAQTPRVMLLKAKLLDAQADGGSPENRLLACAYRTAAGNVNALVARRAPNGLKHFVTEADCGGQQAAYAAAYAEVARHDRNPLADSAGREMAAAFVEGVAYLQVLENSGRGLTAEDYKAMSKPYNYSEPLPKAEDVLRACLFGLAYQRGAPSQVAVTTIKPTAPTPAPDPCAGDTLASLNGELSDVDAKLERFMSESPYAKTDAGVATPMLQVTMWALERNIAALQKHCPSSSLARDRVADLQSSLKHAKDACDRIQSGGRRCLSTDPDTVK